jgi:serine phosphatase RsbU (regulator of sigma subunit)
MLNSAMQSMDAGAAASAELLLADIRATLDRGPDPGDKAVRQLLEERLRASQVGAKQIFAIYLEHRRQRIQRVVTTSGLTDGPSVGTMLPAWVEQRYRGSMRFGDGNFIGGASSPTGSTGMTVIVLARLEAVLEQAAEEMGFHIDQILTSANEDQSGPNSFVPSPTATPPEGASSTDLEPSEVASGDSEAAEPPFTLPWLALFQAQNFDRPLAEEADLVFVQFGFAPIRLYDAIAQNALQLGPDGPDLGRLILGALAMLAALFLVIEVSAIFIGLVLARSITGSVHALSQGTEHVRQGDFGYKVQVRSRDQLGELADSFNLMTTSIQDLLRQSAEKERLEEELRVARNIQMSLLPKDRVNVPGLSIAALCLPATEVGGDYYDFIPLGNDRLALLIADVSGKGTSAALYMAELKGLVLSLSRIYDSPRKLLVQANEILSATLDTRSFITMAYAIIDMGSRRMTYARAGHTPIFQLSVNAGASNARVLAPDGLGLALDRGTRFEKILREESIDLDSGDLFLFFTDGVSEAMNTRSELFGEERLRRVMERNRELSPDDLRKKMIDEVFEFAGGAVQHDDMTMVLVKVL